MYHKLTFLLHSAAVRRFREKELALVMLLNANWLTEILDHWVLSCPRTAASELLWLSLSAG